MLMRFLFRCQVKQILNASYGIENLFDNKKFSFIGMIGIILL